MTMTCDAVDVSPSVQESRLQTSEGSVRDDAWAAIDRDLSDWLHDPSAVVDFGAVPPSRNAIRRARLIATEWRAVGVPAPAMVVPDGNGGLSFEFHAGGVYRNLEVLPDLRVRFTIIRNGRIASRRFL